MIFLLCDRVLEKSSNSKYYFCRLGDVLSSLTSNKDVVPYENSILTRLLADSIGTFQLVGMH